MPEPQMPAEIAALIADVVLAADDVRAKILAAQKAMNAGAFNSAAHQRALAVAMTHADTARLWARAALEATP